MRNLRLHIPRAVMLIMFGLLALLGHAALASTGGQLEYGSQAAGTVEDRFGQEWVFSGQAGEPITIEMDSEEFDTLIELYGPEHRRFYARRDNGDVTGTNSLLGNYRLPATGEYVIVAVGRTPQELGAYTLTLRSSSTSPDHASVPAAPLQASTSQSGSVQSSRGQSATVQGGAVATATAEGETSAQLQVTCSVVAYHLNLRPGPGIRFRPPLAVLPRDTEVVLLRRDASGRWAEALVTDPNVRGWLSTNPRYLSCPDSLGSLPKTISLDMMPQPGD